MSVRNRAAEAAGEAVAGKVVGIVVEGIIAVALAVVGTLTGSFSTVWGFAVAHPSECALWTFSFLFAGAFLGMVASRLLEFGARARRTDYLRRTFEFMPPRRRAIVALALRDGVVSLPDLDADAATLCQLGILGTPPFGFRLRDVDYSIQPAIADIMRKHGAEWTRHMEVEEARGVVYGDASGEAAERRADTEAV